MDNAKLLQDITYYTRMIRERTKQNEKFIPNSYKSSQNLTWTSVSSKILFKKNAYSYVKQQIPDKIENTSLPLQQSTVVPMTKVLINPHFKTRVHINPNFVKIPQSVHINPKILFEKSVPENTVISSVVNKNTCEYLHCEKENNFQTPLKKDILQNSKYKLVRKSNKPSVHKVSTPLKKSYAACIKSKFKLDRRTTVTRKRLISMSKNSSTPKNSILRTKLVNIGGTLYRKSRNKLQRTDSNVSMTKYIRKSESGRKKIVTIRSFRYVKNSEVKPSQTVSTNLKRKLPSPRKKRISIVLATKYKFVRGKTDSSLKPKSKQIYQKKIIRRTNQFRKINVPCPIYCRYGKCTSHDKGICRRVHDPKLVAICKKYLQGACDLENCTLSHNVTFEKMPTCKFYLEGFCSKEKCPYLHVKLNEKVDICRSFLNGFCEAADKCDKRHVHMCPEFERNGNCSKIKCPYPHSKIKLGKKSTNLNTKLPQQKHEHKTNITKTDDNISTENYRYFITDENSINTNNNNSNTETRQFVCDTEKNVSVSNSCKYYVKDEYVSDRVSTSKTIDKKSLDPLPDFIPFS